MEKLIIEFAQMHHLLLYIIIFLAMFVEGEFTLLFAGILIKSQALDFFDSLAIAFTAVILHDIGYWYLGKYLAIIKREKVLGIKISRLSDLHRHFQKREGFYVIMSKFAWGMNRFVLLSMGYAQMKLKKLIKYSILAAFVWSTSLISLGYIFAEKTQILKKDIKMVAIFISIFLLVIIFIENYLKNIIKKEAHINNSEM